MANILIHSLVFAPDGVSTAYLYTDLALALKEFGHKVTVLTTTPHFNVLEENLAQQPIIPKKGKWLSYSEREGIPVWHITMPDKSVDSTARMGQMLKFHYGAMKFALHYYGKYDIILSPSPPLTIGAVSWLLAKIGGGKSVYNVQELYPDFAINQGAIKNPFLIWGLKQLESFVYKRSEKVVAIGEKFREAIVSRGVASEKVHTIPNFVDTELYRPMPRDNAFARENDLVDRFVVMYAGNIGLAQYWEPLLVAAKQMGEGATFVVIGNGTRREWLAQEIGKRAIKNVLILDYQQRERMSEINASCDVATILMDSKVADDGFPSKIFTTMACQKPTVVYCPEKSELATIVAESKCGRWVRDGQIEDYVAALHDYKDCQNLAIDEGLAGRKYVEDRYSLQAVSKLYHEMIQEIAPRRGFRHWVHMASR